MALTNAAAGLTPKQWDDRFFEEYVRESRFFPYEGTGENSVIQVKENLTKNRGDTVYFALANRLSGVGVTGNGLLEGNEEALKSREYSLAVQTFRNATAVTGHDEQLSAIDLRDASKTMLKMWAMELKRDQIIAALKSIDGIAYGTASAAQKNAWGVRNQDRVLFAKTSNFNATYKTAFDALVAADTLTAAKVSLMKRQAQTASPKIRPLRIDGDREFFVLYANSLAFRDLSLDPVMTAANRDARARGVSDHPIFQGGSLIWDGVVIVEIPEIGTYGVNANVAPVVVGPVFLCGAQALGVAMAKRPKTTVDVRDYGFVQGCGVQMMHGIGKVTFDTSAGNDGTAKKDNGIVTGLFSAVAD